MRLPRPLYQEALADLKRRHPFAAERVGFLFVRVGSTDGAVLLLGCGYAPVADAEYVEDLGVGARINSTAIRSAMQRVLDTRQGVFHVHLHEHRGAPRFSWVDTREHGRLVPSFQAVGPKSVHGALVFSLNGAGAVAWPADALDPVVVDRISVVGYPLSLMKGTA